MSFPSLHLHPLPSFSPFSLPPPHFGFISSAIVCVCVRVCIHVIIPPWECIYVRCVCACVRAHVFAHHNPQKPLRFSSVAFSTVAKTGSPPRRLSAANGGAGVGLPGHVSGWRPRLSARTDARQNSLCLPEVGDVRALRKRAEPCGKVARQFRVFPRGFSK